MRSNSKNREKREKKKETKLQNIYHGTDSLQRREMELLCCALSPGGAGEGI